MKAERAVGSGPSRTGAAALLVLAIVVALGLSMGPVSAQSVTTTTTVEAGPATQPSLVIAPPDSAASDSTGSSSSGLSTDAKLALVVGGLIGVAVLIGVLTFFYWRHTRPSRHRAAPGALADLDEGAAAGGGAVGDRSAGADPVTEEIPAFVAAPPRSGRVVEPVEPAREPEAPGPVAPGPAAQDPEAPRRPEAPEPTDDGPIGSGPIGDGPAGDGLAGGGPPTERFDLVAPARAAGPVDDVACIRETLFGSGLPDVKASSLVTLEDLFGPNDDTKGTVQR